MSRDIILTSIWILVSNPNGMSCSKQSLVCTHLNLCQIQKNELLQSFFRHLLFKGCSWQQRNQSTQVCLEENTAHQANLHQHGYKISFLLSPSSIFRVYKYHNAWIRTYWWHTESFPTPFPSKINKQKHKRKRKKMPTVEINQFFISAFKQLEATMET